MSGKAAKLRSARDNVAFTRIDPTDHVTLPGHRCNLYAVDAIGNKSNAIAARANVISLDRNSGRRIPGNLDARRKNAGFDFRAVPRDHIARRSGGTTADE